MLLWSGWTSYGQSINPKVKQRANNALLMREQFRPHTLCKQRQDKTVDVEIVTEQLQASAGHEELPAWQQNDVVAFKKKLIYFQKIVLAAILLERVFASSHERQNLLFLQSLSNNLHAYW
jgi:hypothetical protein